MTTAELSKIERIRLALAGKIVDRPPVSFWAHNFARENSAEELALESVEQLRRHDWDFIKVQSRASVFAEAWGSRYRPSGQRAVPPVLLDWPVRSARDLAAIRPLDVRVGPFGEQIAALRMIRREAGPAVPVLLSIFAPAMVLQFLAGESPEAMLGMIRGHRQAAHAALAVIRDSLASYGQACLENGADGIFFAVKAAAEGQMTREEYAEFGLPYDRPVLQGAGGGWLNMLHLCGPRLYFDVVNDLPAPLLSWGLDPGNPSLSQGRDRTGRAVIGGVSAKPRIRDMTAEEIRSEVRAALEDTGGVRTMIGPGCSISPDTPQANLVAAQSAVSEWQSARA